MKDPLRYFLDEGFGSIYSFPNEEGKIEARMRWTTGFKDFTPFLDSKNGVFTITIGGREYVTTHEFMDAYTIRVSCMEEAIQIIDNENKNWEEIKNTPIGA